MNEDEKWKRKYFQMRKFATYLIREIRKFSNRCADSAERTLHLIAKGGEQ